MYTIAPLRPHMLLGRSAAAGARLERAFTEAWETGVLSPVRLRTGSLYVSVPAESYRIVVMRFPPRDRRLEVDEAWRPDLAPSVGLLGQYRRHQIGWRDFALRYLAQLDSAPVGTITRLLDWLGELPARYPTVTFLCCEHAPTGDEGRVLCHRRLLRAWLLAQQVPDVER